MLLFVLRFPLGLVSVLHGDDSVSLFLSLSRGFMVIVLVSKYIQGCRAAEREGCFNEHALILINRSGNRNSLCIEDRTIICGTWVGDWEA